MSRLFSTGALISLLSALLLPVANNVTKASASRDTSECIPSLQPEITVETVIPPPPPVDPGPSYSTSSEGYFRPRDTLNKDVIRSAGPVSRASSMQMTPQTPRQLLLNPQEHNSWTLMDKSPRSPTIVISPPSEEHLATIDYSNSSQQLPSKHRQSMLKAACLAFFVLCTVVFLIILLFLFS